jgi:hypothetical protein
LFSKGETGTSVGTHLEKNHRALYFLKLLDWESEHEYRYVSRGGRSGFAVGRTGGLDPGRWAGKIVDSNGLA